jgi:hypothetical protein
MLLCPLGKFCGYDTGQHVDGDRLLRGAEANLMRGQERAMPRSRRVSVEQQTGAPDLELHDDCGHEF